MAGVSNNEGPKLVPLPGARSPLLWQHFGFEVGDDHIIKTRKEVVCKACSKRLPYSGNTTNMRSHLARVHPNLHKKLADDEGKSKKSVAKSPGQLGIFEAFNRTKVKKWIKTNPRYVECREALTTFVCKSHQPFNIVDAPSFRAYSESLNPKFHVPHRKTLSTKIIPDKYKEVAAEVQLKLDGAKYVGITTDHWTGRHQRSYASFTAHFINDQWEMKNYALQASELPGEHNHQRIAEDVNQSINRWGLDGRVEGATTDNGSNVKKAVLDALNLPWVPCIGHTLQLSVTRLLKVDIVSRIVGRCKTLVRHFKSTKQADALRAAQDALKTKQRMLVQNVETRWNSTYLMLERIKEEQQSICAALLPQPPHIRALLPDGREWNIIEMLLELLKPFYTATNVMSSSSKPTLSMVAPLQNQLLQVTLVADPTDTDQMSRFKSTIARDLQQRYSGDEIRTLLLRASFLDPRFKTLDFVSNEGEKDAVHADIKEQCINMIRAQQRPVVAAAAAAVGGDEDDQTGDSGEERKENGFN